MKTKYYGSAPTENSHEKKNHDYRREPCEECFKCKVCGLTVVPGGAGSQHRNHCPNCLSSANVDNEPGDREADCVAVMEPIGVWVRKNGEWAITPLPPVRSFELQQNRRG